MNNMFIFTDATKCIGCLNCELACAANHMGITMEEAYDCHLPLISRNRVIKIGLIMAPIQCMHCTNPACLNVCPHDAIQHEEHFVKIYEEKCVGCGCCFLVCPYGSIQMIEIKSHLTNENSRIAIKCDLCSGKQEATFCVKNCPTEAICLIDYQEYSKIILKREQII